MQYQFVGCKPKVITVPSEVKQRVLEKVLECIATIKRVYGKEVPLPTITYDLRGRTAGMALYNEWQIKLNSILLMENLEDMITTTVPHELAHLAVITIHGARGLHIHHGMGWRNVMFDFGIPPDRCHQYDTTNSRMRRR